MYALQRLVNVLNYMFCLLYEFLYSFICSFVLYSLGIIAIIYYYYKLYWLCRTCSCFFPNTFNLLWTLFVNL